MQIETFMERIHLPEAARQNVRETDISGEELGIWRGLVYHDLKQFVSKWKELENKYVWALAFFCRLAVETYERYQEQGISDEVFDQTFYDITIWCKTCMRQHHVYGLAEVWWIAQSVKMELFRLGRLQFEPIKLEREMRTEKGILPVGAEALNVHIPEGEPLDIEKCKESIRLSQEFFDKKYQVYVCDSWLLSPKLKELLPEDSNIIRFQNMFEVTDICYPFRQAEQRIFGEILEEKEGYPEKTHLQRAAKQYVLSGKEIGIGIGVLKNL